jgi:hypothetical protein
VTIAAAPAAQTVNPGQAGQYTLTLTQVGASDPVQLSCSGLAAGVACSFNTPTVTPDASGTKVQLTVTTGTSQSAASEHTTPVFAMLFSGAGLLGLAGTSVKARRRKIAAGVVLAFVVLTQIACGGGSRSTNQSTPPATVSAAAPAVTYTITVNAVSGTVAKSTLVTLTVN